MSTPVRLLAFLGVLVAVLLAGLGLGRAVGPIGEQDQQAHGGQHAVDGADQDPAQDDDHGAGHGGDSHGGDDADRPTGITGLAVSENGYTLRLAEATLPVGTSPFRFDVTGPDGGLVTDFDPTHERDLHLVVVRRDTTGFQHLHPTRDGGTWSTPLTLDRPGAYRVYADFAPAGEPARTLAADVVVPGAYEPEPLPAPATRTTVDGYAVELTGGLDEGEVSFRVSRDGRPVEDLQPYLGAGGHLVVLREGDLGYLHVHPEGDVATGPAIAFAAQAPSDGRYRLFLQFQHAGAVSTAAFTADTRRSHDGAHH